MADHGTKSGRKSFHNTGHGHGHGRTPATKDMSHVKTTSVGKGKRK